jgi:DNA sulfur modification protein DndD
MKFKQLTIENFRPFFGKQTIHFSNDDNKPITLVTAPNNWGKTSIYEAIKWCLYDIWPDTETRDESINTEAIDMYLESKISFDVSAIIDFVHDKKHYRVFRKFKYTNETNNKNPDSTLYISAVTENGDDKKLDHIHDFQLFIQNLLPLEVSKYFIVDGDDFKSFINPTGGKTKEAIEQLLNLKIFDRVRHHLNTLERDFEKDYTKKSGSVDAEKLNKKVEDAEKIIDTLVKEVKKLEGRKNLAYTQWKRYDKELQEATLSSGKIIKIEKLVERNSDLENHNKLIIDECSKRLSKYHTIALKTVLNEIVDELSNIREPLDISPYDRVLLQDIIKICDEKKHVDCLCGSSIKKGDTNYKNIKEKLNTLSGISNKNEVLELQTHLKDIILKINPLKKEIGEYEVSKLKNDQQLDLNISELKTLRKEIDENSAKNQALLAKTTAQSLEAYNNCKLEHAVSTETLSNNNLEIEIDRRELKKLLNVDERTKKLKMKLDLVGNAYKVVENKYEIYRLRKKKELEKKVQKILFSMLTANELFESFKIDDDYEYDVINKNGRSHKRKLSNGQKKVLGVSFVAGLKNVANEDAPFIIDSPLNAIDKTHQINYAKILPDLSTQLILFVTDAELTKNTLTLLKPKIGLFNEIEYKIKNKYNRSKFVEVN